MNPRTTATVEAFDSLPDVALIDVRAVALLTSAGISTVWQRVKAGQMPQPQRRGKRYTRWTVGSIRAWLQEAGQ